MWGGGKNFPIFLSSIGYEYIRWPKVGGSDVLARDKSFLGPTFLFLIPSLRGGGASGEQQGFGGLLEYKIFLACLNSVGTPSKLTKFAFLMVCYHGVFGFLPFFDCLVAKCGNTKTTLRAW